MAKIVKVSLLHPQNLNLDGAIIRYPKGIQPMPYEHAQMLGVTRRIVEEESTAQAESVEVFDLPFVGAFDDKLTEALQGAGYKTLGDVAQASEDQLRAIKGIGPANFEIIQTVLGRRASQETEGE